MEANVLRTSDERQTGANICEFLKAVADDRVLVTNNASTMSLAAELGNFLLPSERLHLKQSKK